MPTTIIMTYDAYASYDVSNDVAKKIKDGTYKSYNKHGTLYWIDENGKENKVEAHDYQEDYKRAREDVEWDYNEEEDTKAEALATIKANWDGDDACSIEEDDIHQCKECKDFFDYLERDGKNGICGDCFCCCECGCECQTECFTIGCGGSSSPCEKGDQCNCECHESTDSSSTDQ
jgi:hypothetical protein